MSYCTRTDIERQFGPSNVSTWSDLENKGNALHVIERVVEAIVYAEEYINGVLLGGPYSVPFIDVPEIIKRLAATFAGIWLYESRGVTDFDNDTGQPIHRYAYQKQSAKSMLLNIKKGTFRLPGVTPNAAPTVVPIEDAG